MDTTKMRTWAEIDLSALSHNYQNLRSMLPPDSALLGVCKANAYGHGAPAIGRALQQLGCDMLAVACLEEAIELRQEGITLPILCLGQTPPSLFPLLLTHHCIQMVEDLQTGLALAQEAGKLGQRAVIHLKLDTGMGRYGFSWHPSRQETTLQEITQLKACPELVLEGLFTHFAHADGDPNYTMKQFRQFLAVKEALAQQQINFRYYHCASSAAALHHPCTHLNLVRVGLALYGYDPGGGTFPTPPFQLQPILTLKSRIAALHPMPRGSSISYGCTAVLQRDTLVAIVPVGYGDGYPRLASGQTYFMIHQTPCPILGRICMDMCMVDVTHLPQVQVGDLAFVYQGDLLQQVARAAQTIPYELLCHVSPRVPRIYLPLDSSIS